MTSPIRQLVTDQLETAGVDASSPEAQVEIDRLELAGIIDASGTPPTKMEAVYWALGELLGQGTIRAIGMKNGRIVFTGRDTTSRPARH